MGVNEPRRRVAVLVSLLLALGSASAACNSRVAAGNSALTSVPIQFGSSSGTDVLVTAGGLAWSADEGRVLRSSGPGRALGTPWATPLRTSLRLHRAVDLAGDWGKAEEVPGIAALSAGRGGVVFSLSCASAGNCAAGGSYESGLGIDQAFVVDETGGLWGKAEEVPGTAALNTGGGAFVFSLSCASAGNCSAGGAYADRAGIQAFVVDETDGIWGKAAEVPGTAVLNADGFAQVITLSCASPGNCAAGGSYRDSSNNDQAFVVDETDGTWRKAEAVPGTPALNGDGLAYVDSVSCGSPGDCAAGGTYFDGSGHTQAFVSAETDGTWHKAEEVPGTAALNAGGDAGVFALSCIRASSCTGGGSYANRAGHARAFVIDETDGIWGKLDEVPHTAALNAGASVGSLSCTSVGDCAAGGTYTDGSGHFQAFVVDETDGSWRKAEQVPGTATLNAGGNAQLNSLSCRSAGDCAAGGFYKDSSGHTQAFVVDEVNGSWRDAEQVPGTTTLNAGGNAQLNPLSCTSAGVCAAGGFYLDRSGQQQAFVVGYSPAPPTVPETSGGVRP